MVIPNILVVPRVFLSKNTGKLYNYLLLCRIKEAQRPMRKENLNRLGHIFQNFEMSYYFTAHLVAFHGAPGSISWRTWQNFAAHHCLGTTAGFLISCVKYS